MPLFRLYSAVATLAAPVAPLILRLRKARGKEDPTRLGERLGHATLPRPAGPLVWLHGASVGEAVALLPLIERLARTRPDLCLMLTTGTVTSAAVVAGRLPPRAWHQFVPIDTPGAVARFLDHWRPDLVLWSESDFWPTLLRAIDRRGIPRLLLNGRISDRSLTRWRSLPGLIAPMVGGFALCLGQTTEDARRLALLGAGDSRCLGNLKQAAPPPEADPLALAEAAAAVGDRPCWLMASTHPGEEALAARVHRRLSQTHPGLLTLIVPRHADRAADIARDLASHHGALVLRRRTQGWPTDTTALFLGDTMGEMGLYYRLAPVVVMGKTFTAEGGGQNPLEPARLGCALVWGPGMTNFAQIASEMAAEGAAEPVATEDALAAALDRLLTDPALCRTRAEAARAYAGRHGRVLDDILDALSPFLDRLSESARPPSLSPPSSPSSSPSSSFSSVPTTPPGPAPDPAPGPAPQPACASPASGRAPPLCASSAPPLAVTEADRARA